MEMPDAFDEVIAAVEERKAKSTPEEWAAIQAKLKVAEEEYEKKCAELGRQRKRDVLKHHEKACMALVAAVESLRPFLVAVDDAAGDLRRAVPLANPSGLVLNLTREVAGLNVRGARSQIEGMRATVETEIERSGK